MSALKVRTVRFKLRLLGPLTAANRQGINREMNPGGKTHFKMWAFHLISSHSLSSCTSQVIWEGQTPLS